MKNLKKLLALVLVLVMALGMIPFASAASSSVAIKDFTDFNDIEQVEAVVVLTAIGVLSGYPDGSFQPKGTITRAEASKIICYILLGANVANALQPADTGFRDVPSSHWASAYVAYCAQKNIISGYGNGRFGPEDKVTAVQMAKMLLGAVGYGQNGEYDGEGWQLRVVEKANALDIQILSGTGSLDFTTPATREQVARYTFNAMTIPNTVVWNSILNDYSYWSNAVLGTGTKFPTLGEKTFGLVEQERSLDAYGYTVRYWRLYGTSNVTSVAGPYRMDVSLNVGENGWTSTNGRSIAQLTTPGGPNFKAPLADDARFFVNGIEYFVESYSPILGEVYYRAVAGKSVVDYTQQNIISYGHRTPEEARAVILAELNKITENRRGVIVDLVDVPQTSEATGYRFFDGRVHKVIIIEKTPGAVTAPPRASGSNTVIPGLSSSLATATHVKPTAASTYISPYEPTAFYRTPNIYVNNTNNYTFTGPVDYPEDLKGNDYVLYWMDGFGVTHVEKAVSVPGQLTAWRNDTNLPTWWNAIAVFGDNEYTRSGLREDGIETVWRFQEFIQNNLNRNRDATAYLDDNGSVFAFVLGTVAMPNYLVLAERTYWTGGTSYIDVAGISSDGVWVNAIFADGTRKEIKVTNISSPYMPGGRTPTAVDWNNFADVRDAIREAYYVGVTAARDVGFPQMIYSYTENENGTYSIVLPYTKVPTAVGSQANRSASVSSYDEDSLSTIIDLTLPRDLPLPNVWPAVPAFQIPDIGPNPPVDGQLYRSSRFLANFASTGYESLLAGSLGITENLIRGDETTIFIHYSPATARTTIFTGVSNAPQFGTNNGPVYMEIVTYSPWTTTNNMARIVYLQGGTLSTVATGTTLVFLDLSTRYGVFSPGMPVSTMVFNPATGEPPYLQAVEYDTYMDLLKLYGGLYRTQNAMVASFRINGEGVVTGIIDTLPLNQYGYKQYGEPPFTWSYSATEGYSIMFPVVSGSVAALGADGIYREAYSFTRTTPFYTIDKNGVMTTSTMGEEYDAKMQPIEGSMWFVTVSPTNARLITAFYLVETGIYYHGYAPWSAYTSAGVGTGLPGTPGITDWTDYLDDVTSSAIGTADDYDWGMDGGYMAYIDGSTIIVPPPVPPATTPPAYTLDDFIDDMRSSLGGQGFFYNQPAWATYGGSNYVVRMSVYKDGAALPTTVNVGLVFHDTYNVYIMENGGLLGLGGAGTGSLAADLTSASTITLLTPTAGAYAVLFELCTLTELTPGNYEITPVAVVWGTPIP